MADPPRLPYGAFARMPGWLVDGVGTRQGRRLVKALPGAPKVVVIFHPLQYPTARGVVTAVPGCELWYGRWDRYEEAYDAPPKMRARIAEFHELAAARASLTFVASDELARLEADEARERIASAVLHLAREHTATIDGTYDARLYVNVDAPAIEALLEAHRDGRDTDVALGLLRAVLALMAAGERETRAGVDLQSALAGIGDAVKGLL